MGDIGHTLAPKEKVFREPGMERIEITSPREDEYAGRVTVCCDSQKKHIRRKR